MSWVFALLVPTLLTPTLAFADRHWADNYTGGSGGDGGSTLVGVHDSLAFEIRKFPVIRRSDSDPEYPLGFVAADFSVQFGNQVTQVLYMAGARYTWAPWSPTRPSAHANKFLLQTLLGTVYTNDGASESTDKTNNDFALGLGFGYERVKVIKGQTVTFRFIYDRIKRGGEHDDWFNRASAGIAYRWERQR
jgi:hypothetical protein